MTDVVTTTTPAKPAAKTANQVINDAYKVTTVVDHTTDLNSTGGIQNAIKANARAIRMLADHVDGIYTDPVTGARVDKSGKPVVE